MTFGSFDADQFRRGLTNYTDTELTKLGRSVSSTASRWLDPMTQQLNASKYELCKQEYRRRHPKKPDLTGPFCTSRREREFTRRTAGYAHQEVQSRTDRDDTASD